MEKMLEAAEKLYGPYRWTRYDVLVLPPSFPFGGMENPRLTFATPTIIAATKVWFRSSPMRWLTRGRGTWLPTPPGAISG